MDPRRVKNIGDAFVFLACSQNGYFAFVVISFSGKTSSQSY